MNNDEFQYSELLKYIPGFRSNNFWKSIIAIFYYLSSIITMINSNVFNGLILISLPFIFFYGLGFIVNRKKENYNKNNNKILLAAISILFVSTALVSTNNNEVSKIDADIAEESVEKNTKKTKLKKEKPKANSVEKVDKEEVKDIVYKGERDLKIHFIDVGQGDSIFLELPNGENVLIDGGPKENIHHLIKYLRSLDFHVIDHLVVTNFHEDHIGGISEVTRNWKLGNVYLPDKSYESEIFKEMLLTFKEKGYSMIKTNNKTTLIDKPGLTLKAIAPLENLNSENLNDYNVVLKLDFNDNSFLFMGNAEEKTESELIKQDIKTDVLKVANHGSDTSSTKSFIEKTNPKYSIITCGQKNKYGYPSKNVVERLEEIESKVYRTDIDGTIIITSDGNKIEFEKKGNPIQPKVPSKENKSKDKSSNKEENNNSNSSNGQSKPSNNANNNSSSNSNSGSDKKQEVTGETKSGEVYITKTGSKYHSKPCGRGKYFPVNKQEAINRGLTPCAKCY